MIKKKPLGSGAQDSRAPPVLLRGAHIKPNAFGVGIQPEHLLRILDRGHALWVRLVRVSALLDYDLPNMQDLRKHGERVSVTRTS